MKFADLYNFLTENSKDPSALNKKAYQGAPQGIKGISIDNPEKFIPASSSRKMFDPSRGSESDKGRYIPIETNNLIKVALTIAASSPDTGKELQRVMSHYSSLHHEWKAEEAYTKRLYKELENAKGGLSTAGTKLRNKGELSMYGMSKEFRGLKVRPITRKGVSYENFLVKEIKKHEQLAGEWKTKCEAARQDTLDAVQDLVKEGSTDFVKKLEQTNSNEYKSLQDIDLAGQGPNEKAAINFLKDIYRGKTEFEPLSKFAQSEMQEGIDPVFHLLTIYKTVLTDIQRNNLLNSPERIFNYIVGKTQKSKSISEPTKGRVEMKKKDPAVMKVIALIKQQKFEDAKHAVNDTKLSDNHKADLMISINKLKDGQTTEADVIRPLYQM
jgi:hypothetical protein